MKRSLTPWVIASALVLTVHRPAQADSASSPARSSLGAALVNAPASFSPTERSQQILQLRDESARYRRVGPWLLVLGVAGVVGGAFLLHERYGPASTLALLSGDTMAATGAGMLWDSHTRRQEATALEEAASARDIESEVRQAWYQGVIEEWLGIGTVLADAAAIGAASTDRRILRPMLWSALVAIPIGGILYVKGYADQGTAISVAQALSPVDGSAGGLVVSLSGRFR